MSDYLRDGQLASSVTCMRCGHEWFPRKRDVRICPICKSARWDQPRRVRKSSQTEGERKARIAYLKSAIFKAQDELLQLETED